MGHWLNVELWGPMWPNMFAPSAFTLTGLIVSHIKRARQAERHHQAQTEQNERHHQELKDHISDVTSGSEGK